MTYSNMVNLKCRQDLRNFEEQYRFASCGLSVSEHIELILYIGRLIQTLEKKFPGQEVFPLLNAGLKIEDFPHIDKRMLFNLYIISFSITGAEEEGAMIGGELSEVPQIVGRVRDLLTRYTPF